MFKKKQIKYIQNKKKIGNTNGKANKFAVINCTPDVVGHSDKSTPKPLPHSVCRNRVAE